MCVCVSVFAYVLIYIYRCMCSAYCNEDGLILCDDFDLFPVILSHYCKYRIHQLGLWGISPPEVRIPFSLTEHVRRGRIGHLQVM